MEELCGQEIFQFQESASVFLERQWRQFLGVNQWLWVCPFLPQVTVPCHSITYQPGGGQKPSLNSHLPRQNYKIVKTLIPLRKPLDRMAQTFFRWPQRLIKQMLHGLHYIFLWQTLFIPPSSFPSRYNRSQLTLISRKTFWGRTLWRESFILWTNNQTLYRVSSLVVLAHKKSHQLREIVCFCCSFRCRVFMLPVARAY